jgi:hypothetical protein
MQPVVPAKAADESSNLQLFLTEAIAAGSQFSSSINSVPSSTSSTATVEAPSTLTALIRFSLTDGQMNYTYEEHLFLEGNAGFMGAVHYLPESQQLSLLLTETLDESDSDESLRSAFYLYSTNNTQFVEVRRLNIVISNF